MKKVWNKFQGKLDDYGLKKKLNFLYLFCVLLPLLITDSIVVYTFIETERVQREHEMENIANAVQYNFCNNIEMTARIAKSIYMNKSIDEFLNKQFMDAFEYVVNYQDLVKDTMLGDNFGLENIRIKMYSDNETIVNGGKGGRVESVKEVPWYQYMQKNNEKQFLYFYFDNISNPAVAPKRKMIFVRRLDFYSATDREKFVTLELDYSKMVNNLVEMNYEVPIYICMDDKVLFSNEGHSNIGTDFEIFLKEDEVAYTKKLSLYGVDMKIYILETEMMLWKVILDNLQLILLLLFVNMILPQLLMSGINRSFTVRIKELSDGFNSVNDEKMIEIISVHGNDEIGNLMRNYNRMVERINELIQTVYKDKLREQEIDIARKNAELLALQSQINPHFLFNALESIRMHSILKKEYETADMIEKLATMERQNVDWSDDLIEIQREMEFIEAYLGLQKYRFGDRISYEFEIAEECKGLRIPRLTVVTFVENACVHGIESKTTNGWIFVRVYKESKNLCIEIEDTGCGMDEDKMKELRSKMENASIELLKKKGRVGIVNACLRLKMITEEKVRFNLEGEKGVGTMVQIRIPLDCL